MKIKYDETKFNKMKHDLFDIFYQNNFTEKKQYSLNFFDMVLLRLSLSSSYC